MAGYSPLFEALNINQNYKYGLENSSMFYGGFFT